MVYFFSILIILIIVLYGSLLNELCQNCAKSIYSFFETLEAVTKEFSILCHLLCPDITNSSFILLLNLSIKKTINILSHFFRFVQCFTNIFCTHINIQKCIESSPVVMALTTGLLLNCILQDYNLELLLEFCRQCFYQAVWIYSKEIFSSKQSNSFCIYFFNYPFCKNFLCFDFSMVN